MSVPALCEAVLVLFNRSDKSDVPTAHPPKKCCRGKKEGVGAEPDKDREVEFPDGVTLEVKRNPVSNAFIGNKRKNDFGGDDVTSKKRRSEAITDISFCSDEKNGHTCTESSSHSPKLSPESQAVTAGPEVEIDYSSEVSAMDTLNFVTSIFGKHNTTDDIFQTGIEKLTESKVTQKNDDTNTLDETTIISSDVVEQTHTSDCSVQKCSNIGNEKQQDITHEYQNSQQLTEALHKVVNDNYKVDDCDNETSSELNCDENNIESNFISKSNTHISILPNDKLTIEKFMSECVEAKKCKLCCDNVKRYPSKLKRHFDSIHNKLSVIHGSYKILACKLGCKGDLTRVHYHCFHCDKVFLRKGTLTLHMETIAKRKNALVKTSVNKKLCLLCNVSIQSKHFKRHLRLHSKKDKTVKIDHDGKCIDPRNGMYLVANSISGNPYPVHVQVRVSGTKQTIRCENTFCTINEGIASRSDDATYRCPHVRITQSINSRSSVEADLDEIYLHELISKGRLHKDRLNGLLKMRDLANLYDTPPVAAWFPLGENSRTFYLSVLTDTVESYCKLGRVVILVDTESDKWTCKCEGHRRRRGCMHKSLAKWFLMQFHPNLICRCMEDTAQVEQIDLQIESDMSGHIFNNSLLQGNTDYVDYLHENKRIPIAIPNHIIQIDNRGIKDIIPTECICPVCSAPFTDKDLIHVTSKGWIVCHRYVVRDVNVFVKKCSKCDTVVRHQEYQTNLHNYNNHLFLTITLCSWLRNSIQSHIAPSRVIDTIAHENNIKLPVHDIRCAYYLFEALTDFDHEMKSQYCLECSYHPPCLIFDTNQNVAFDLDADDLSNENHAIDKTDNDVDVTDFWSRAEKSIIFNALVSYKNQIPNPYHVKQSYKNWAPWIPVKMRLNANTAVNSETEKLKCDPEMIDVEGCELNEDLLNDIRIHGKREDVVELANSCGFNVSGFSKKAILDILSKYIEDGNDCSKLFEKVPKISGGLTLGVCPHGIAYNAKFLIGHESERDFFDLLVSQKHPPTITICDVPRKLVQHGNKRVQQFFFPNDGMLARPTQENLDLAADGKLKVDLPYIRGGKFSKCIDNPLLIDHSYRRDLHPLTGVGERFALYDRFHESNTTSVVDHLLRSVKLVPELRGVISTEICEQKNSFLDKDIYFLNMMKHTHHIIVVRSLLMIYNFRINTKLVSNAQRELGELSFDRYGRLILGGHGSAAVVGDQPPLPPVVDQPTVPTVVDESPLPSNLCDSSQGHLVSIKQEYKSDCAIASHMAENYDTGLSVDKSHLTPDYIFTDAYYVPSCGKLSLHHYDPHMWRTAHINRETIFQLIQQNGTTVTKQGSPFMLSHESVHRVTDPDEFIDGEMIDAMLMTLGGLLGAQLNMVVLSNHFLTHATSGNIEEWVPAAIYECDAVIMAAHHPKHWCFVLIDINHGQVFYLDS